MCVRLDGQMMKHKIQRTDRRFSDTGVSQSPSSAMPQSTKLYQVSVHQIVLGHSPPNTVRPQSHQVALGHNPPSSTVPLSTR